MGKRPLVFTLLLLASVVAACLSVRVSLKGSALRTGAASYQPKAKLVESYGRLPLSFEANYGQASAQVKFLSRGGDYNVFLTSDEMVLGLGKSEAGSQKPEVRSQMEEEKTSGQQWAPRSKPGIRPDGWHSTTSFLRMKFMGASPSPQVTGLDKLPSKSNYFIGNDPKKWQIGVPNYSDVKYTEVYPGVDIVFYGRQRELEFDIIVTPGANPQQVRLQFEGVDRVELSSGEVVLESAGQQVRMKQPFVYQPSASGKRRVAASYVRIGRNQIGFQLAAYDARLPLVLDPTLAYSTYLGGSAADAGKGIAVDSAGNAYITGQASSIDFPSIPQFENSFGGSPNIFVLKLSPTGTSLVYSTIIGGLGGQSGNGIAVDAAGNAYVTGVTNSPNFPIVGGFQTEPSRSINPNGTTNVFNQAFVLKLSPDGTALIYSSYLGGSGNDMGRGIAVDSTGNAYVTGNAVSFNFPTKNAIQAMKGDLSPNLADAFVTKVNAAGNALVYSTYLGGAADDQGAAIAVDGAGNAYVTGETISPNFPTVNPLQGSRGGNPNAPFYDAFVTKINSAGTALLYSTYFGGSNTDAGNGIAVDGSGSAFVAGFTFSRDFPVAPPQSVAGTAFVAKFSGNGSTLIYSRSFGGNGNDVASAVAVDAAGNAYLTGSTTSTNFPSINAPETLTGLISPTVFFAQIAFVTKVNPNGTALVYSTPLGGGSDSGAGIAVDATGNAYVTGQTGSPNFPTVNAFQMMLLGRLNAFAAKLAEPPQPPPLINPNGVVNAASFRLATDPNGAVAPGAIVAIFGQNLAPASRVATALPLPTTLFDTTVTFNGVAAPLFYVSSTQINAQVPFATPTGMVTLKVQRGDQMSAMQSVSVAAVSPGIFTLLQQGVLVGAILHAKTFAVVSPIDPAVSGEFLSIFTTGLGALREPIPDGAVPPSPPPETVSQPTVTIAGVSAPVVYSGLAAKFAGVYQVNVQVPPGLPSGEQSVQLTINGIPSNSVALAVR